MTGKKTLTLLAALISACVDGQTGPAAIVWDRDACTECTMVISDPAFAAQVRSPKGQAFKFDDVGCAVRWLDKQPWARDPAVAFWVSAGPEGRWVEARGARFESGKASPMGYGFAAGTGQGVDFTAMQRSALAVAQPGRRMP